MESSARGNSGRKVGTKDNFVSHDKMLDGPYNMKIWKSTLQSIFEREDLWIVVRIRRGRRGVG
jgi:hypothetical protein